MLDIFFGQCPTYTQRKESKSSQSRNGPQLEYKTEQKSLNLFNINESE